MVTQGISLSIYVRPNGGPGLVTRSPLPKKVQSQVQNVGAHTT